MNERIEVEKGTTEGVTEGERSKDFEGRDHAVNDRRGVCV